MGAQKARTGRHSRKTKQAMSDKAEVGSGDPFKTLSAAIPPMIEELRNIARNAPSAKDRRKAAQILTDCGVSVDPPMGR